MPGAAPNTLFDIPGSQGSKSLDSAKKPFRIGKPCCQFVRSACALVSAVLVYKYSPGKHAAGHLRCLDNLLYRRREKGQKSLSAKMILTFLAPDDLANTCLYCTHAAGAAHQTCDGDQYQRQRICYCYGGPLVPRSRTVGSAMREGRDCF